MEARSAGNYESAVELFEECIAYNGRLDRRGSGVQAGLEFSLCLFALVLRERGEYARASSLCEEGLALSQELNDADNIAIAFLNMTDLARDQGNADQIRVLGEEALARFRALGHPWGIGFALNNLALAAFMDGDLTLAADLAQESELVFRDMQADPSLAETLVTMGRIRGAQSQPEAAHTSLTAALGLTWKEGPRIVLAAALEALAVEAVRQGHAAEAVTVLSASAELRRSMGVPVRPADQPELDDALAEARRFLGVEAFAAAWTAGRTLSLEQVVRGRLGPDGAPSGEARSPSG
jgi:tetratricopeptide (TPR) repeat protein